MGIKFNGTLYKGLMTALQGFVAAIVLIATGVFTAVQGTPGCFDAVVDSLTQSGVQIAALFGVGSGVASFVMNIVINKYIRKA